MDSKMLASKLLSVSSKSIIDSLASYSSWLLVGFGVALTLIVSNINAVTEHISICNIKFSIYLFLISLLLGVMQRLIFAVLSSSIISGVEGGKLGEEAQKNSQEIDFEVVFSEMLNAAYWPVNKLIEPQLEKLRQGDFAVAGRM
jgi:hypothetical protein